MTAAPAPMASPAGRWPWGVVLIVCAAALAINLITIDRSPAVWQDEVMFADPAINLATGHGFRTSAWMQAEDKTFAGNSPLYPLLLAGWLKAVGLVRPDAVISPAAVRSLNYLLMTVTVGVICLAAWRAGAVRSRLGAGLLATVLWGAWATTFSYRSGRYDVLGMLLVAAIFLAATIVRRPVRLGVMAALAILLAWAGLQNLVCVAAIGVIVLLLTGRRWLAEVLAVGAGSAVGLAGMLAVFWAGGLLDDFRGSVISLSQADPSFAGRFGASLFSMYRGDISTATLIIAAIVLLVTGRRAATNARWLWQALAFGLGVPVIVAFVSKFPVYYGWMGLVPAAICLLAFFESADSPAVRRWLVGAFIVASCFMPARQILTVLHWRERDAHQFDIQIANAVRSDDVAVCSFVAYYPVKRRAAWVGLRTHLANLTPARRETVSVLVLQDRDVAPVQQQLGGSWVEIEPTNNAAIHVLRRSPAVPGPQ